jgi:integrase/recombinase XerD
MTEQAPEGEKPLQPTQTDTEPGRHNGGLVGTVAENYLAEVKERRSAGTFAQYRREVETFVRWLQAHGINDVAEITKEELKAYWRERAGRRAVNTQRWLWSILHAFQGWMMAEELPVKNFMRGAGKPPQHFASVETLTRAEVELLLRPDFPETPASLRSQAITELYVTTGARRNEIAESKLAGLNLEEAELTVVLKGSRREILFLSLRAVAAVRAWLERGRWSMVRGHDDGWLFPGPNGGRPNAEEISAQIGKRAEARGIAKRVRAHVLRHTFATELLKEGANISIVQRLMHHKHLVTTSRYLHPGKEILRENLKRFHPQFSGEKTKKEK